MSSVVAASPPPPPPAHAYVHSRAAYLRDLTHRIGNGLAYVYALRVPLIVCLLMFVLPIVAVPRDALAGSLLRGLFDIADRHEWFLVRLLPFALLTFIALMLAATVGITARLIILDGCERFRIDPLPPSRGFQLVVRLIPAFGAAAIVAGAWAQSAMDVGRLTSIGGIAIGSVAFWLLMKVTHGWIWPRVFRHVPASGGFSALVVAVASLMFEGFRWFVRLTPRGFVDPAGKILARHAFALLQLLFSIMLFLGLWAIKANWGRIETEWLTWLQPAGPPRIPTLSLVLVLMMLSCWVLTALTFTFDRYRVPLITILAAYFWVTSVFPQGDHFFRSIPRPASAAVVPVPPEEVLKQRRGQSAVLVAATGGGIQAAAWTARVLSDLQKDSVSCQSAPDDAFDRALLALSTVSGGSVGAMYVVDAYRDGRLDPGALELAVKAAEASSLDQVAWGLTYPDLLWTVAPWLKGIWFSPPHILNGPNLVNDRGTALEDAWKRSDTLAAATLDAWRTDLRERKRPAVIFNSTVAETGQRMVLSTTTVNGSDIGRRDFFEDYAGSDIAVTTAARLSATFPFVSPPARISRSGVFANEFHFVDGGYYDNYGTATLVEWLHRGVSVVTPTHPARILILQVRSSPDMDPGKPDGSRGTIFEVSHPLTTLYHVRGTGQLSHSDLNVDLLRNLYGGQFIRQVTIRFPARLADEQDDASPPLSWHLTPLERYRLAQASHDPEVRNARLAVHDFLSPGDVNADRCVLR